MSHDHHNHCDHQMAYCAKCDVAYCKKCSREWGMYYSYPYYPYWQPVWSGTGYTDNTTTTAPQITWQNHSEHS